jgi:hypothetical protein
VLRHPLLPARFRGRRGGIGDACSDLSPEEQPFCEQIQAAASGQGSGSAVAATAGTAIGTGAGAAAGSLFGPAGTVVGGAIGGAVGGAVAKLFTSGAPDPEPGDWQSWCQQNMPQGGSGPNFAEWGWGPCPGDPNATQGYLANLNASVPAPAAPKVVSGGVPHAGAQPYGSPAWVASMTALAATGGSFAAMAQAQLAQYNAQRVQGVESVEAMLAGAKLTTVAQPKLAGAVSTSHPLLAMAKAPKIGVSASASPTETVAVLALAALGFVAWRKGWL